MITYEEYYRQKDALENIMPSKRDISNELLPLVVSEKALELRLIVLGSLQELNAEGWEDED